MRLSFGRWTEVKWTTLTVCRSTLFTDLRSISTVSPGSKFLLIGRTTQWWTLSLLDLRRHAPPDVDCCSNYNQLIKSRLLGLTAECVYPFLTAEVVVKG